MRIFSFRLKPGSDLKESIESVIDKSDISAGFIITCVGGLQQATVRMAGATPDKQDIRVYSGNYEIVSLVGTVSVNGTHLHVSFSDRDGNVIGGHLKEGTLIHPTAEIIIGVDDKVTFNRIHDEATGFSELVVE